MHAYSLSEHDTDQIISDVNTANFLEVRSRSRAWVYKNKYNAENYCELDY